MNSGLKVDPKSRFNIDDILKDNTSTLPAQKEFTQHITNNISNSYSFNLFNINVTYIYNNDGQVVERKSNNPIYFLVFIAGIYMILNIALDGDFGKLFNGSLSRVWNGFLQFAR